MTLILALSKQRQTDHYELEVSLVCRMSSKTVRVTQRNPVLLGSTVGRVLPGNQIDTPTRSKTEEATCQ